MSNGRSLVLSLPPASNNTGRQRKFAAGAGAALPLGISPQTLYRQNAALRAQNIALKLALDGQTEPPRHDASAQGSGDPSAEIYFLLHMHLPIPRTAADVRHYLTQRQRQVLDMVLAGCPSKNIAADLRISQRTVESHRAAIMRRTGATSIPALARIVIGAAQGGDCKAARTRQLPQRKAVPCRHATPSGKVDDASE